jgi:cytochrome c
MMRRKMTAINVVIPSAALGLAVALWFWPGAAIAGEPVPGSFGLGKPAKSAEIAGWDIDIRGSDGQGLPAGNGSVLEGEKLYGEKCASCHGDFGEGNGRFPELIGGQGSLAGPDPVRSIASYWPYAPTLFDYIRRAMPFTEPQSLNPSQTYAIVAYLLNMSDIVPANAVLDAKSLAAVKMPNRGGFTGPDPRPDVKAQRCMKDCAAAPAKITSDLAKTLGVTPKRTGD